MFQNLSVRARVNAGILLVIVIFGVASAVSYSALRYLVHTVNEIDGVSVPMTIALENMDIARVQVQQFLTDVSATHEKDGFADAKKFADDFQKNAAEVKRLLALKGESQQVAAVDALSQQFQAYYDLGVVMANTYMSQGMEAGNLVMKGEPGKSGFDATSDKLAESFAALKEAQLTATNAITVDAVKQATRMEEALFASFAVALVAGLVVARFTAQSIVKQLGGEPTAASQLAVQVGAGDLTDRDISGVAAGTLMGQLLGMRKGLALTVREVRVASDRVLENASSVSRHSHELASKASTQAAALEQAAASMEVLGASVETNTHGGVQAAQLARSASVVAERGGALMVQVVASMSRMADASNRVLDIIGVIDGIAFQTNILALNAAVEAARAGEQGRGFAVVASEVRALAGRSAAAAKEVKTLIGASVQQVEEGHKLVNEAGETINEVVATIRKVADLATATSDANHAQALEVGQMGQTISVLDQDLQRTVALVEELDRVAAAMDQQARQLHAAMGKFKTDGEGTALAHGAYALLTA